VAVGDVNRGEVLAARDDPIQQSLRLLRREKGVHENGVVLTGDECRRIRHPHQFFLTGWQIANEARALYREHIPLKISFRSVDCIHRRVLFWCKTFAILELAWTEAVDRDLGHVSCTGLEQMLTKPFYCGSYRDRKLVEIGSEVSA
jgi:hypothetical protein